MIDRIVGFGCAVLGLVSLTIPTAPQPVQIIHVRWAPLTQWTCRPQEFREHQWVCAHRKVSAAIKERK